MRSADKFAPVSSEEVDPRWRNQVKLIDLPGKICPAAQQLGCVGLTEALSPKDVVATALETGLTHIVQKDSHQYRTEINTAALMLNEQELFAKFPISSILSPLSAGPKTELQLRICQLSFYGSEDKDGVLRQFKSVLEKEVRSKTLISECMSIADELVTNSVFNAPFVDQENSTSGVDRKRNVRMDGQHHGSLFFAKLDDRILIGSADTYGKLNAQSLVQRFRKIYESGVANNISMGRGGAGIGSFMVFNSVSSLYLFVDPNALSLVCCTLPAKMSHRKRSTLSKNLHFTQINKKEATDGTIQSRPKTGR